MTPRRPVLLVVLAAVAALALVAAGCSDDDANAAVRREKPKATTSTTAETVPPTTAAAPVLAPLLGTPVEGEAQTKLARPALAVKIDNSPPALPQAGINAADVVLEIKVEGGISRLMPVFHSTDAGEVGPIRSARFSDPDLLAMFGKPLFGWSGANDQVHEAVDNTPWIVNVNWERFIGEYRRVSGRRAPHNVMTSTQKLFAHAQAGQPAPTAIFQYLAPGESNPGAQPAAGSSQDFGATPSQWVWDGGSGRYLRWQYGRRHGTDQGQAWTTNVVILGTTYSQGHSPIATSVGVGPAMVLTGGTVQTGVWGRPDRTKPYQLLDAANQPIKLTPGRTWIELPDPGAWSLLSQEAASKLLTSGR